MEYSRLYLYSRSIPVIQSYKQPKIQEWKRSMNRIVLFLDKRTGEITPYGSIMAMKADMPARLSLYSYHKISRAINSDGRLETGEFSIQRKELVKKPNRKL